MKSPANQTNIIRHPEFARRMSQACDSYPRVPAIHDGRLRWFVEELEKLNFSVKAETVRRWLAGIAMPRKDVGLGLAAILKVDAGWLLTGARGDDTRRDAKKVKAVSSGAVFVAAGLIQMDGGFPAFPEQDDVAAQNGRIDLYAIIKGVKYNLHVTAAIEVDQRAVFAIPVNAEGSVIIGLLRNGAAASFDIFEMPWEQIVDYGRLENGAYYVPVDAAEWKRIENFTSRF